MSEAKSAIDAGSLDVLPNAKDLMKQIALREAEKASAEMKERSAADAEKKALIEKFSKASGVSDEEAQAGDRNYQPCRQEWSNFG